MANGPHISIEVITPEIAATMLGTMRGNRGLRQRAVQRYAREMIADRWLLNGEAIKVDKAGRLVDGQHRLNAVLAAKRPVKMLVVRGVDESAMITLDTGVGRSFYDYGTITGKGYAQKVGPIARWWHFYTVGTPTRRENAPSYQEMETILAAHPSIVDSARFIASLRTVTRRCVPAVQGFVHSYCSEKYDREMADSFMNDLNDGAELEKGSPIFALRRRLIDEYAKGRPEASYVLALSIKAWNAWMGGTEVKAVSWRSSGPMAEDFPRFDIDATQSESAKLRVVGGRAK